MTAILDVKCRYCGVDSETTDIYLVARNKHFEGFCLSCYEKHLDDKRNWKKEASTAQGKTNTTQVEKDAEGFRKYLGR
jgi:hypothetical protein